MKKFENPAIELEKLDLMDVIATSTTCWCDGYNEECPFEG